MNRVRKPLSVAGLTVVALLFASASLYGQDSSYKDRFLFSVSSTGYLDFYTAVEGGSWAVFNFGQQIPTNSPLQATVINSNNEVEVFYICKPGLFDLRGTLEWLVG